jgi:filamentous hemagglutinin family protein
MTCTPRTHARQAQRIRTLLLSGWLLLSALLTVSQAQITLDGSLGPRGPVSGPNYRIGHELGQIRGSNLFHSFGEFHVPTGGSATFTGPDTIANIVGRVTGGQPSSIDGALRSEITGANLFLLNPAGVMFGPNASLDVSGSFHASTGDFLRFADGAQFFANPGRESVLTVAPPAAFGFLGNSPTPITIQGSSLKALEGKALSVVAGDVQLIGGKLVAPSGRIQLASVASPGEVLFSRLELAPDLQVHSFTRLGRLELSQGGLLDVSGNGGGTVLLRSNRLLVDRSQILANTQGNVHGASLGLDLRVTADAVIHDSDLRASPFMAGNGGNIVMNAGSLTLADGGRILNSSRGAGRGGTLTVAATDAITITGRNSQGNQSGLFSNAFERGDAGHVAISALTLSMDDGQIQAGTVEGSRGNAGGLEVRVGTLRMNGGNIWANTLGDGHAGNLEVRVGQLTLLGGAQISNSSGATQFIDGEPKFIGGQGQGGDLTVVATESITIAGRDSAGFRSGLFSNTNGSGDAGRLLVSTPSLSMDEGRIVTRTLGDGNAGDIEVKTGRLTLTGGAQIFSGIGDFQAGAVRGTQGPGRGGNVTVSATESIFIAGRDKDDLLSSIISIAQIGRGHAGNLSIATPTLTMDDAGRISAGTSSLSGGDAGNIELAVGRLTLTNGAQISSSTSGPGRGGDLQVAAQHIQLSNGSFIAARGTGEGAAGTLLLQAGEAFRSENGRVTTAAEGAGGGRIELRAGRLVQLRDSEVTTSVRGGGGDAGNLTLDSPFIVADGSRIVANAFGGRGGNIGIGAAIFLADPASLVSASSALGIQGTVDIRAPVTTLSGTLAPLPQAFVSAAALLPTRCAARFREGRSSSLVLGGRDALPLDPSGVFPSPLTLDERLAADPAVTGGPHQRKAPGKLALLAGEDKVLPRLRGQPPVLSQAAGLWGCAK